MQPYTDIMVDLETFATDANAAIVSIGAVAFNEPDANLVMLNSGALLKSGQGFKVNVNLSLTDAAERGNIDPATVEWWMGQPDAARLALFEGQRKDLRQALKGFRAFVTEVSGNSRQIRMWSNGPAFDEAILNAAYSRYGISMMDFWSFRGSRCCRTLTDVAETAGWDRVSAGIVNNSAHDALADAVYQARIVNSQRNFLRLANTTQSNA